jgi:hypothetical protein
MSIYNLFSKRRKRESGEVPDVYTYEIPANLRVQIIHIWGDALGNPQRMEPPEVYNVQGVYQTVVDSKIPRTQRNHWML